MLGVRHRVSLSRSSRWPIPSSRFRCALRPGSACQRFSRWGCSSWNQKTAPSPVTLYQPTAVRSPTTAVYEMSPTLYPLSLQFAIEMRAATRQALDIGCGDGVATAAALARGGRVLAVDPTHSGRAARGSASLRAASAPQDTSGKLAGSRLRVPHLCGHTCCARSSPSGRRWRRAPAAEVFPVVVCPGQTFHQCLDPQGPVLGTLPGRDRAAWRGRCPLAWLYPRLGPAFRGGRRSRQRHPFAG